MATACRSRIRRHLLGLWGLPFPVVEAAVHHHSPGAVAGDQWGILGAVHVADSLAHEIEPHLGLDQACAPLDLAFLEAAGVADRLSEWREIADREAAVA
jgi:HD-like signal output (HDOD) protein